MLQEPAVMAIFELTRKVGNEAHFFREFIRFASLEDRVLVSHIEPKCNILTLIAPNFADRMPSENWMIIDDTRYLAIVHSADTPYYLTPLSQEEYEQLSKTRNQPDIFIDLWKDFFQTIAIEARKNYRCQRTMMPLWYRKNAVEFQSSDT
jgi:probable DNA metabolism protein